MSLFIGTRIELSEKLLDFIPDLSGTSNKCSRLEDGLKEVCPSVTVVGTTRPNLSGAGDSKENTSLEMTGEWEDIVKVKEFLNTFYELEAKGQQSLTLLQFIKSQVLQDQQLEQAEVKDTASTWHLEDQQLSMKEKSGQKQRSKWKEADIGEPVHGAKSSEPIVNIKSRPGTRSRTSKTIVKQEPLSPEKPKEVKHVSTRPKRNVKHKILPLLKSSGNRFHLSSPESSDSEVIESSSVKGSPGRPKKKRKVQNTDPKDSELEVTSILGKKDIHLTQVDKEFAVIKEKNKQETKHVSMVEGKSIADHKGKKPIDTESKAFNEIDVISIAQANYTTDMQLKDILYPQNSGVEISLSNVTDDHDVAAVQALFNDEETTIDLETNDPSDEGLPLELSSIPCAIDEATLNEMNKKLDEQVKDVIKSDGELFKCSKCDYKANNLQYTQHHVKRSHMPKDFKCHMCPKAYGMHKDLISHLNTHARPHICGICSKGFARAYLLKQHNQNQHARIPHKRGPKPKPMPADAEIFHCNKCPYVTHRNRNLLAHLQRTHKEKVYKCSECDQSFDAFKDLINHKHTHGATVYECDTCHKILKNKYSLKIHKNLVHLGVAPILKSYQCELCGKISRNKTEHKVHMNKAHWKVRPFKCDKCGMSFFGRVGLKEHMNIHEDVWKFSCKVCGKQFKQRQGLRCHLQTHKHPDELPHKCATCQRTFTQMGALLRHIRTHTGARPYVCKLCDSSFNDYSILRRHLTGMHKLADDMDFVKQAVQEACEKARHYIAESKQEMAMIAETYEPVTAKQILLQQQNRSREMRHITLKNNSNLRLKRDAVVPAGTCIIVKEEPITQEGSVAYPAKKKVIVRPPKHLPNVREIQTTRFGKYQAKLVHSKDSSVVTEETVEATSETYSVDAQSDGMVQMSGDSIEYIMPQDIIEECEDDQDQPAHTSSSMAHILIQSGDGILQQAQDVIIDSSKTSEAATSSEEAPLYTGTTLQALLQGSEIYESSKETGQQELHQLQGQHIMLPGGQQGIVQSIQGEDEKGNHIIVITNMGEETSAGQVVYQQGAQVGGIMYPQDEVVYHQSTATGEVVYQTEPAVSTVEVDAEAEVESDTLSYTEAASVLGMLIPQQATQQDHGQGQEQQEGLDGYVIM